MASNAKGVLFVHLRTYCTANQGAAAWDKVLGAVTQADRTLLQGIMLAGSWYPVGTWNRSLRAYLTQNYKDLDAAMVAFANYVAEKDLNSVVKVLLRLGSPEFILTRTGWLWARYFDQGNYEAKEEAPRQWRMWLGAPTAEDEGAGALTCGPGVAPWLQRGLVINGAKNAQVKHVKCRFNGQARCEYEARWSL